MILNPFKPTLYKYPILHYDYTNWTSNHIWLHKQPFALWCISFSIKIFGTTEFAVRFPSLIFSTISIYLVYKIALYLSEVKSVNLATFYFSINGLIVEIASGRAATDHPDTIYLFLIIAAIWASINYVQKQQWLYNFLVGSFLGLAMLTKWLPALIVLPIWFLLVFGTKHFSIKTSMLQFVLILGVALTIFLPWQFYIMAKFPKESSWEYAYNSLHFFTALEGHRGHWYYYINRIRIDYGELVYLPIIWLVSSILMGNKNIKTVVITIWIFISLIFFSIAATKMNGYLLVIAPAIFIITAQFFYSINKCTFFRGKIILTRLIQLLLIALPIRYCVERIKPLQNNMCEPKWVAAIKKWGVNKDEKTLLFGYNAPIEAMFYTNATVYENLPSANHLDSLANCGYKVYVAKSINVEQQIKEYKNCHWVNLDQKD